jgi:hypothetical protein
VQSGSLFFNRALPEIFFIAIMIAIKNRIRINQTLPKKIIRTVPDNFSGNTSVQIRPPRTDLINEEELRTA